MASDMPRLPVSEVCGVLRSACDPDDGERGIVAERAGDGADGDAVVAPEDQGNRAGRLGVVDASGDDLVERRGVRVSPRVCFPDAGHRWWARGLCGGEGHGRLGSCASPRSRASHSERADVIDDAGRAENGGSALHALAALPRRVGRAEDRGEIFGTPARDGGEGTPLEAEGRPRM